MNILSFFIKVKTRHLFVAEKFVLLFGIIGKKITFARLLRKDKNL